MAKKTDGAPEIGLDEAVEATAIVSIEDLVTALRRKYPDEMPMKDEPTFERGFQAGRVDCIYTIMEMCGMTDD